MNTDISTYNIRGGVPGVGKAIGLEIVHGMRDVRDVREFVSVSKALSLICSDEHFGYCACLALANSSTLQMLLKAELPAVCDHSNYDYLSFIYYFVFVGDWWFYCCLH